MKRLFPVMLALAILILTVNLAAAQDTTDTTTTAPTRTVQIFFVACADQVVLNLSGIMTPGYDIYYQVTDIGGNPLTGLRQVAVNGTYSVSDRVNYAEGTTLAAGAAGIANIRIAVEGGPNNIDFETTVIDTQDGCASPQNNAVTSTDLGGAGSGTTPQGPTAPNGLVTILTPGGGELNPSRAAEELVEIGVRQSDVYRSENAGLIFAECDSYPRALPGILYDTDNITIFWSWFAKSNARLQEHLANAQYAVRMNGAGLPNAQLAQPGLIRGDHWAFYTVPIGNLRPGHYEVEFKLDWTQPISDGYDDYGPGTNNPQVRSLCNFDIRPNETGQSVQGNAMFNPTAGPVHNLQPQF